MRCLEEFSVRVDSIVLSKAVSMLGLASYLLQRVAKCRKRAVMLCLSWVCFILGAKSVGNLIGTPPSPELDDVEGVAGKYFKVNLSCFSVSSYFWSSWIVLTAHSALQKYSQLLNFSTVVMLQSQTSFSMY